MKKITISFVVVCLLLASTSCTFTKFPTGEWECKESYFIVDMDQNTGKMEYQEEYVDVVLFLGYDLGAIITDSEQTHTYIECRWKWEGKDKFVLYDDNDVVLYTFVKVE